MKRVLAAFFSPLLLFIVLFLTGYITSLKSVFNPLTMSILDFFVFYIISLPFFILLGIPLSLIIDKIKKSRFINYIVVGIIIGTIVSIFEYYQGQTYEFWTLGAYTLASLSYYLSLIAFEAISTKLQIRYTNKY